MTWDEQWSDEKTIQKWLKPDRRFVKFSRELKSKDFKKAFDLGCGAGRHVVFLAKEGYETYASDFSEPAVKYCQDWLDREGLSATVTKMDMFQIPYPDSFFDLIIAYNVIYHSSFEEMKELVQLIRDKLRPGGYFFVSIKSTEEWNYGQGEEIEKNTFLRPLKGVPVHFSTEEETDILFEEFELVSKEYFNYVKEKTGRRHAFWEFILRKND